MPRTLVNLDHRLTALSLEQARSGNFLTAAAIYETRRVLMRAAAGVTPTGVINLAARCAAVLVAGTCVGLIFV